MDSTLGPRQTDIRASQLMWGGRSRQHGVVALICLGLIAAHGLARPETARAQHSHAAHAQAVASDTVIPRIHHPEPRTGITAARVLAADELTKWPDAAPTFDMVRKIPHVLDGIHCWCGCHERSLLSCFEGEEAMGRWCSTCQAQAQLVYRLHEEGKTLEQIRAAMDAEFSPAPTGTVLD